MAICASCTGALRVIQRAAYNGGMFLLLYGPDDFSAAEELARLRATGGFEHNQDTFDGQTADLGTLCAVCDTMPFLSERRLVILNGLPKRKRTAKGEASDALKLETSCGNEVPAATCSSRR